MHVAIYVQHLLGSGHLARMRSLARSLAADGYRVSLISGGDCAADDAFDVFQLPPLHTRPGDFTTLLDNTGEAVDEAWKTRRSQILLKTIAGLAPDIMVVETWPFGRRQMAFEILPMLDALRGMSPAPPIVGSVRDILQQRSAARRRETLGQIEQYLSLLLVHGDSGLVDLSASFPEHLEISCPVRYTGYIDGAADDGPAADNGNEVVVSAGGGAAGIELMEVALATAALMPELSWRILVGQGVAEPVFRKLRSGAAGNVTVERNRADFRRLLKGCAVSVSQFGYNTAVDLLSAGCPAVVVPYAGDGETEQSTRAAVFAEKGWVDLLPEDALNAGTLHSAIVDACRRVRVSPLPSIDLDGCRNSTRFLRQLYRGHLDAPA